MAHTVSSPYREKVLEIFAKHKTPLHMGLELPTLQAIKQFVALGSGVALMPEISVETEVMRGELVRIPVRELQCAKEVAIDLSEGSGTVACCARLYESGGSGRCGEGGTVSFPAGELKQNMPHTYSTSPKSKELKS